MAEREMTCWALVALLALPALATAADEVRDPMQPTWLRGGNSPAQSVQSPRQRFSVDTIVVSPERRVAIINGRSVGVGEWINGAKVLKIDPDAVTLELDGARFTIALAITDIKKTSRHGG